MVSTGATNGVVSYRKTHHNHTVYHVWPSCASIFRYILILVGVGGGGEGGGGETDQLQNV